MNALTLIIGGGGALSSRTFLGNIYFGMLSMELGIKCSANLLI